MTTDLIKKKKNKKNSTNTIRIRSQRKILVTKKSAKNFKGSSC